MKCIKHPFDKGIPARVGIEKRILKYHASILLIAIDVLWQFFLVWILRMNY
jgi:hypothetical protein